MTLAPRAPLNARCGECQRAGKNGTYTLNGTCSNCGARFTVALTPGHEYPLLPLPRCTECECRTVRQDPVR